MSKEAHCKYPKCNYPCADLPDCRDAEQPAQQEPVEWGVDWGQAGQIPCVSIIKRLPGGGIEVVAVEYGPERTWVSLTDEEIDLFINGKGDEDDEDYVEPTGDGFGLTDADLVQLVRKSEAKLKEKNT